MVVPWLAVSALACYSESDFSADYFDANCQLTFECYSDDSLALLPYEDVTGCADFWLEVDAEDSDASDCETFVGSAARDCIAGLEALDCESFQAGDQPDSCSDVCT